MLNFRYAILAMSASVVLVPSMAAAADKGPRPPIPLGNPGDWVTSNDYPTAALKDDATGTSAFTLLVDETGAVVKCSITQSSGSDPLDEATCALVSTRALFSPATDASGKPVKGTYSNRIRWVLPDKDPLQHSSTFIVSYEIDKEGNARNCRIVSAEVPNFDDAARDKFLKECDSRDSQIYRDDQGNPIAVRITISHGVRVEQIDPPPKPAAH